LEEIRSDKQPIGGSHHGLSKAFTNHWVEVKKGDVIYMFSDGYADQFGGESGKKMMVKNLKEQLLKIHSLPMQQQHEALKNKFIEWRSTYEQVDDVLIIGIRIP
jgi:serine phosphatase RsbU (regulator of sigma subunit)